MIVTPAQPKSYPVSFTAASLRPELARIVAQAYLDCGDWERARERVLAQNLLQARSPLSAIRMEREIRQRLQTLTPQQLYILIHAPISTGAAIAWLSVLKHSPFVFAFAVEVLRAKFESHDTVLRPSDYEGFFEAQVVAHPELARLTVSTRQKMRRVMVTMLREVGIVTHPGKDPMFGRPMLPPDVLDSIVADQPAWLAGFLVPDREIQSFAR